MKSDNLWVIKITIWTIILAVIFTLLSQNTLSKVGVFTAFFMLFSIVFMGIIFDMIGVAATVAETAPINAKAAKKIIGAKQALFFVRNAERVAVFCNDVIGDISGIVSGGAAAAIIFRMFGQGGESFYSLILTSVVAGITVGGKGIGKTLAIKKSTEILVFVGKIIYYIEKIFPVNLTNSKGKRRKKGCDIL
ncbi:hypothetical protein SAMN02745227_00387 [Anaerobranca californiensis DSM 14826]|uniref:CNNM transmembrane domain-containing protein n=1 Tax=Anaerobranca californiensis DSM 14826 TaxID=1120989 RepID=A0A1M6L646_9FIRM|nr:hypothetical protein [Anaerobranca californiensis]SHJ66718.1 hypothetical protein SAMN02745227_00387 [Anaerobranca californiensis DSM 14826]